MSGNYLSVANAQLAVGKPAGHPEFAGNVKAIEARGCWQGCGPNMNPAS
jgi:hypothetical protein